MSFSDSQPESDAIEPAASVSAARRVAWRESAERFMGSFVKLNALPGSVRTVGDIDVS
jgi:hypothetical protein